MRILQLAAVFLIPIGAVALALTFRAGDSPSPLLVQAKSGSYEAIVGKPLSVAAFTLVNTTHSTVTVERLRVVQGGATGIIGISAWAYRGCTSCVADSAVPPHVTPPDPDVAPPRLVLVPHQQLKPGERLTLLLSMTVTTAARTHVPPLRIDVGTDSGVRTIETLPGPAICAGKSC
jgi:hypothetical protein